MPMGRAAKVFFGKKMEIRTKGQVSGAVAREGSQGARCLAQLRRDVG